MDIADHEFEHGILEQFQVDRERILTPHVWPRRPQLPMVQHQFPDGRLAGGRSVAHGFLREGEGPIIHVTSSSVDVASVRGRVLFEGADVRIEYPDWDALQRDGWLID